MALSAAENIQDMREDEGKRGISDRLLVEVYLDMPQPSKQSVTTIKARWKENKSCLI